MYKITALRWTYTNLDNFEPDMYCFYTRVEPSVKDKTNIGNFVIRESDNSGPSYIYLILNREFLPNSKDLEVDIDRINYDNLSVLYGHDECIQYYKSDNLTEHESYYLKEDKNGKFQKYYNIDEVLQAIEFKDTMGNQFSYIPGEYKIEECCWRYLRANYFKKERQNSSLEQVSEEKEKPIRMILSEGENISTSIGSMLPYLSIHNGHAPSYSDLVKAVKAVEKICHEENNNNKKKSGGKSMFDNLMKNFKFGKMDTNAIKYSFNGVAFQTEDNDYVVYNPDMTFTNVSEMVMDIPIYVMPVPKSDIKIGDIIIHNSEFVIVQSIESKEIRVARPRTKEIVGIIPEKSVFGFDFYTKVIDFTKNFSNNASTSNPFGNLPMLMMMNNKDSNNDMLMFMLMNGGAMDFNNPMFMYMMMSKSDDKSSLLPPMMLMNQNKNKESMTGYKINNSESKIVLNTEGLNWYPVD